MIRLALVICAVLVVLSACGGDSSGDAPIDLTGISIEDIQQRAMAAVSQPGMVLHIVGSTDFRGETYVSETWLYPEGRAYRTQSEEGLSVCYGGARIASFNADHVADGINDPHIIGDNTCLAASYLSTVLSTEGFNERDVGSRMIGGEPAFVIRVESDIYESSADRETTVFLDDQYLPLKMEQRVFGAGSSYAGKEETNIEYEFMSRSAVPADFFDRASLIEEAEVIWKPRIDSAKDAGVEVYWAGESIGDLTLAQGDYDNTNGTGLEQVASLELRYRSGSGFEAGDVCGRITHMMADVYEQVREQRARSQEAPRDEPAVTRVPYGTLAVYEGQRRALLALPNGDVVELDANCDPPYRGEKTPPLSEPQFEALLAALRPYDGP